MVVFTKASEPYRSHLQDGLRDEFGFYLYHGGPSSDSLEFVVYNIKKKHVCGIPKNRIELRILRAVYLFFDVFPSVSGRHGYKHVLVSEHVSSLSSYIQVAR